MIEPLDVVDLLENLADVAELTEIFARRTSGANDFKSLLSAAELGQVDASWLETLVTLDRYLAMPEYKGDGVGGGEVDLSSAAAVAMPALVEEALAAYPAHYTQRLAPIRSAVDDLSSPVGVLASLTRARDGAPYIAIHERAVTAWETLHHVLGRHAAESDSSLRSKLLAVIVRDGLDVDLAHVAAAESSEERSCDVCAIAIARYRCNPLAMASMYPNVALLLESHLGRYP